MSGICTKHKSHKPNCTDCTALPYDSRYEENMEIVEVCLSDREQLRLFKEICKLNCRPSDYFKYALLHYIDTLDTPPYTEEIDNPDNHGENE